MREPESPISSVRERRSSAILGAWTTSRIASAVGIHPNTVRLYERIGFITAPERLANGYRVFTDLHLLQVRLVRAALNVELVQNGLRREVLAIVETMASQRYDEARALCRRGCPAPRARSALAL